LPSAKCRNCLLALQSAFSERLSERAFLFTTPAAVITFSNIPILFMRDDLRPSLRGESHHCTYGAIRHDDRVMLLTRQTSDPACWLTDVLQRPPTEIPHFER